MAELKKIPLVVVICFVLSCVQGVSGLTVLVTNCGVLSAPGEYYLINDILNSPATTCIEITASNVLFSGNGHTIDGTDNPSGYGIWVHGPTPLNNVVVSDVTVTQWLEGIYLYNTRNSVVDNVRAEDNQYGIALSSTDDSRIQGSTVRNNHMEEIHLWVSSNNTIRNNRIESPLTPGSLGLLMTQSSKNRVYNNYINNTRGVIAIFGNTWNTSKASGTSIVSGPVIGGNFWATPSGNGYSETCPDTNGDGFCDAPYSLNSNNTDQLPLKEFYKVTGCRMIATPGTYSLQNDILDSTTSPCIQIMGSDIRFEGNGHTIDGTGSSSSWGVAAYNLSRNPQRVEVTNLTVQEWGDGIYFNRISDGSVTRTVTTNNTRDGMYFMEVSGISVTDSALTRNREAGAGIVSSHNMAILRNRIADQRTGSKVNYGLIMTNSTGSTIADNNVSWNGLGIILWSTTGTSVRNNSLTRNGNAAILLCSSGSFPSVASGNTLEANNITGNGIFGIALREGSTGNTITNNTIMDSQMYGIELSSSSTGNILLSNSIAGNSAGGIYISDAGNNLIADNYFNNTHNVDNAVVQTNIWNLTKLAGPNVIGGPYRGGNYWAQPDGLGFSETCTDGDGDGFCDVPYILNANNTDQLALTDLYRVTGCRRITVPGTYHLENDILDSAAKICIEILGSDIMFDGGGHRIEGNGTAMTYGIVISNLPPYEPRRVGVADVTLRDWGTGLFWHNGIGGNLTRALLSDNLLDGLYVLESRNISIDHISVSGNGEAGVGLITVQNSSLTRSHLFANNKGSPLDYGMVMTDTTNTLIADNNVSENGLVGIFLYSSRDNTLRNNTLNANGHYGLIVSKTTTYPVSSGNTLTANTVTGNGQSGISIRSGSTLNTVAANRVSDNINNGIEITGSSTANEVRGNTVTNNSGSGIYIEGSSANLIADNYFSNTKNFGNWTVSVNTWNLTKQAGPNVIGGPYRGGNFWAFPNGTGFSETCADTDGDGICNTPLTLDGKNTDHLPLKERGTLTNCTVITQPGTYIVENDIVDSNAASCIRVVVSDVIVDGKGHTIDGIGTSTSRGVHVAHDTKTVSNVTIRDLKLTNWGQGIFIDRAEKSAIIRNTVVKNSRGIEADRTSNSSIVKNTVSDNSGHGILLHISCNNNSIAGNTADNNGYSGIYLHEHSCDNEILGNTADNNGENGFFVQVASDRNTFRRNIVMGNAGAGISVWGSSGNTIADNSFNNSVNAKITEVTANTWNASRQYAKNILGGPVSGGNSWAQPDGLGFSQTCADANNDGICDDTYVLDGKNTDRLPLVAFTLLPLPGYSNLPTDPDGDGLYEDLSGNGSATFTDVVLFFDNMEWVIDNEPVFLFDFSRNGAITFKDIVLLFEEV